MKEYVLNYYPLFKCVAEKCNHTCCAGWEISIDSQSLTKYKENHSDFSSRLKRGINFRKSKFKTDKSKRCAFLNDKSLCEIIINLGENELCQVCRDHPRFRSFFNDRIETGLGFCCEESAKIILSFKEKIKPQLISEDKNQNVVDFNQKNVLKFREKALKLLQNRTLDINDRIENLLNLCNTNFFECDFSKILKTFLSFERCDKSWTKVLKSISLNFTNTTEKDLSLYCEQFLVNSLYRHLSVAEDTIWVRARTIACIFSWWIIKSIISLKHIKDEDLLGVTVDAVRNFSTEVEYSQKNLNKLFSFCYKFIKI